MAGFPIFAQQKTLGNIMKTKCFFWGWFCGKTEQCSVYDYRRVKFQTDEVAYRSY